MRLERSGQLLEQHAGTVSEVGFKDVPHFSRSFKSHFGVTPSEYASGGEEGKSDGPRTQNG